MSSREVCRSLCSPPGQLRTLSAVVCSTYSLLRTAKSAKRAPWRLLTAPPAGGAAGKGSLRSIAAAGLRSSLTRLLNLEAEEAGVAADPAGSSKEAAGSGGESPDAMAAHEVDEVYECQRFFGPLGW